MHANWPVVFIHTTHAYMHWLCARLLAHVRFVLVLRWTRGSCWITSCRFSRNLRLTRAAASTLVCTRARTCIFAHMYTARTCTHIFAHMYTHMHTARTCTHIFTATCKYVSKWIKLHGVSDWRERRPKLRYVHSCTRTCIFTHMQMHFHAHLCTCPCTLPVHVRTFTATRKYVSNWITLQGDSGGLNFGMYTHARAHAPACMLRA